MGIRVSYVLVFRLWGSGYFLGGSGSYERTVSSRGVAVLWGVCSMDWRRKIGSWEVGGEWG